MLVDIKVLSGEEALPFLDALASLRIDVFREFPYLYEGSLAYEKKYLKKFSQTGSGVIVAAFLGKELVGATTGLPLMEEAYEIKQPLISHVDNSDSYFYLSEILLQNQYRRQGVGNKLLGKFETHIKSLGKYKNICFCTVVRPETHPRKPRGYVGLDGFWEKGEYRKITGLSCKISWQDLDEEAESPKVLEFWSRKI